MPLTMDEIISEIQRRIVVPSSQGKYFNTDYREFIDSSIANKIVPKLISIDENYCVDRATIPLVASTSKYRLPERAVCWALDSVGHVDSTGVYRKLSRITKRFDWQGATASAPDGFYLEDGYIYTVPNMGASVSGSFQLGYYRRRNKSVLTTACGHITNVATIGANYSITVDNTPEGTTDGADFISGTTPYDIIADDAAITIVGLVITVATNVFDRVPVIGDWVCQTGYTPIPQLPDEWHYLVADYVAKKILIGSSDAQTMQLLDADINDTLNGIKHVMQTRVKGSTKRRVSNNPVLNRMRGRGF